MGILYTIPHITDELSQCVRKIRVEAEHADDELEGDESEPTGSGKTKKRKKNLTWTSAPVQQPLIFSFYNNYMGGG